MKIRTDALPMKAEDQILFSKIQQGNRPAFQALFDRYYAPLTRFAEQFVASRPVAEDIVQSFFVHFWERADTLHVHTSLKAYCYHAVRNRCLNHLRSLRIEDQHHLLYLEALMREADDEDALDADLRQTLAQIIAALPPKMAEIVHLRYQENKPYQEIATLLNITQNTVKTQLQRAKFKMRQSLAASLLKFPL